MPKAIVTDRNRLSQIIINLTYNALKFTFEGGITLAVKPDTTLNRILFQVKDTGVGIKDEDKKKLFKRDGKLEDSNGINPTGCGLGLSISTNLVKLLNHDDSE